MRYAIISDIHSNLPALEAVCRSIKQEKPDRVICLGDVVGYGAEPEPCCNLVRSVAHYVVLGNHDAAVCGRMNYSYYYDAARIALDKHVSMLSPGNLEWLESLPYRYRDEANDIDFCHGSPTNVEEFGYVFILEQACALLPLWDELACVTFIGHSHLTKAFVLDRNDAQEIEDRAFCLDEQRKYVITVGSVGQPRDYDARACYSIYDTETREFRYIRLTYPVEEAVERIFEAEMAINFGKRLFLGV